MIKTVSKMLFGWGKWILLGRGVAKLILLLVPGLQTLIGWIWAKVTATTADTESTAANTGGLQTFIATTNTAGKGTLAFAGAMAIMAAGVAVVILAFAELVESFGQAGDNAGWATLAITVLTLAIIGTGIALVTFGASIGAAGKAAEPAVPIILALSAAFAGFSLILHGYAAILREVNTLLGRNTKRTTSLTVSGEGMSSLMETMATHEDSFAHVAEHFERIAASILSVDKTLPKFTRMFQAGKAFAAIETAFRGPPGGGTAPAGGGGGGTQTLTIPIHIGERKLETWVVTIADGQITKRVEEESLKAIGAL